MITPFQFSVPTAVRFGCGVSEDIVSVLPADVRRVALVRGRSGLGAGPIRTLLAEAGIACHDVQCSGEPSVPDVNAAVETLMAGNIQAVVAVGGGSVLDLGKAIAVCLGHNITLGQDFADVPASRLARPGPVPCIAVPTTAGTGAEVTANAVLQVPELQSKVSLRGRAMFPTDALVDPELLKSAPAPVLLSAGLDAVVQTLETYTSAAATPFSDALASPNISRGLKALKQITTEHPPDSAWQDMAWVSLCSGIALANGGLGAAHGIASVLGGRYGAPHGAICGRLIVPVLRKNLSICATAGLGLERMEDCATYVSVTFPPVNGGDAFSGLDAWMDQRGLPRLREFGLTPEDIPSVADASGGASSSRKNPVPLARADFEKILEDAI